jgi:predicted kinase
MEMIMTRGLPASGKTTWAKKQKGYIRINRDDIRAMLFTEILYTKDQEEQVTIVQHGAIKNALKNGQSVIIDDTNLNNKFVRELMKIAQSFGAEVKFEDFTDVPYKTCIERDASRDRSVGADIIANFYVRYIQGRQQPLPVPVLPTYEIKKYEIDPVNAFNYNGKPWAVIVDIDGTVAKMIDRGPYDWSRVGEDSPVEDVFSVIHAMAGAGFKILFTSGRDGSCRNETEYWLKQHYSRHGWELFMRTAKDNRPDWIVKAEIFDNQIRDKYNIRCVFDDRNQVVDMWRKMGLTVMQVAEGDF